MLFSKPERDLKAYFILFSPVLALVLQSYFKSEILSLLHDFDIFYWVFRAGLFALFIFLIYRFAPEERAPRPTEKFVDPYGDHRNIKDPLLGLRAFACLCVFFGHWFYVIYVPSGPATGWEYALRAALGFSPWGGVWIFYTLSGYLMAKGFVTQRHDVSKSGLIKFYGNRVLRIFPIYFAAVFLVTILAKPEYLDFTHKSAITIFLDTALFDLGPGGVVGALWSVSTEFQFYLLVPLLFLLLRRLFTTQRAMILFALIFIVLLGVAKFVMLRHHPGAWYSKIYVPVLASLDCFIGGFAMAFIVKAQRSRGAYLKHGMTLGFVLMGLLYLVLAAWSYPEMVVFPHVPGSATRPIFLSFAPGVIAVMVCAVIYSFELATRTSRRPHLFWKVQTYLGLFTYCIYVWHEPIITSLRKLLPPEIDLQTAVLFFPVGAAATLLAAAIFYYAIEKRFDKLRR